MFDPITLVMAGVVAMLFVIVFYLASKVGNVQLVVDSLGLDQSENSQAIVNLIDQVETVDISLTDKVSEVLTTLSGTIDVLTKKADKGPSFDSLKALQDRLESGYTFSIKEAVDKVVNGAPDGIAVVLASILDVVVEKMKTGVTTKHALQATADGLRTTVAIRSGTDMHRPDDGALIEGVLRGDNDAIMSFLDTPYARKVLRGILGGSDQVL